MLSIAVVAGSIGAVYGACRPHANIRVDELRGSQVLASGLNSHRGEAKSQNIVPPDFPIATSISGSKFVVRTALPNLSGYAEISLPIASTLGGRVHPS